MIGIRCGGDDSRDHGAVSIAILGAVAGEHVVTAGHGVRQPWVRRHPGVDDRDPLTRATGELPNLW